MISESERKQPTQMSSASRQQLRTQGEATPDMDDKKGRGSRDPRPFDSDRYLLDDDAAPPPEPLDAADPPPLLPPLLEAAPPPLPLIAPPPELELDDDDLLFVPPPPGLFTTVSLRSQADSVNTPRNAASKT